MKMNIAEIAKAVDAQNDIEQWSDIEVSGVAFDSRHLKTGDLFVPLMGARDGHEFVNTAFKMVPVHLFGQPIIITMMMGNHGLWWKILSKPCNNLESTI